MNVSLPLLQSITVALLHCLSSSCIPYVCLYFVETLSVFSLPFQDECQRKCIARKLLCLTEVSSGFKHGVSPMLIQATKHTYEFMEPL